MPSLSLSFYLPLNPFPHKIQSNSLLVTPTPKVSISLPLSFESLPNNPSSLKCQPIPKISNSCFEALPWLPQFSLSLNMKFEFKSNIKCPQIPYFLEKVYFRSLLVAWAIFLAARPFLPHGPSAPRATHVSERLLSPVFALSLLAASHSLPGFWDSDRVGRNSVKFTHFGPARDNTKPTKKIWPNLNFQTSPWSKSVLKYLL